MSQLKNSPPTLLAEILKKTLKNLNIEEKFKVYPLWKQWALIVGDTVASKSTPDYIMASKLYVSVTSPVWIQELSFQKQLLLEKIKTFPNLPAISDIVFRLKKN